MPLGGTADDWWPALQRQFQYLSRAAAEWWVSEDPASGSLVGYARSIDRGGLFELTEFFVLPARQTKGVGRALLERAFPAGRGQTRTIIATTDVRALARYYAADTAARFPLLTLTGPPASANAWAGRLDPIRVEASEVDALSEIARIEQEVLEYGRDEAELRWLLEGREGYLYRRDGRNVGFLSLAAKGRGRSARYRLRTCLTSCCTWKRVPMNSVWRA